MDKSTIAALQKLADDTEKTYGSSFVRKVSVEPYKVIPTGIPGLDFALGVGGLVLGRVGMYWGPEGAGKSTAAMAAIASAQRTYPNRAVGLIDMEQSFDAKWAVTLGVDLETPLKFFYLRPESSEDVADAIKKWVNSGLFSLIVVDSIGGMIAKTEMEKDADESAMGKNPQVITRMVKMSAVVAAKNNTSILLINQVRAIVGGMRPGDTYAGPKALRHVQSQRVKFSRTGTPTLTIKEGDSVVEVGKEFRAKVERSKVAAVDGKQASFMVLSQSTDKWGPAGLDNADSVRALAELLGLVQKKGSHFLVPDGQVNGKDAFKEYLRAHPDYADSLLKQAIEKQAHLVETEEKVEFEAEFPEDE
jgi:recombination protein RecA